jgi:hypothetical protein
LLYKLQKYVESDGQCNVDTSTVETSKEKTKCVQMFVAWKVKNSEPFVYIILVEHAEEFTWDEDKLKKLYDRNSGWLKEYNDTILDMWSMDDNVTLKTSLKVRSMKGSFELSAFTSEEKDEDAIRPLCVDLER